MIASIDIAGLMAIAFLAGCGLTAWICSIRHRAVLQISVPDERPARTPGHIPLSQYPKHLPLPPLHLRDRRDIFWCDPCKLWGVQRQHACVPPTTEELKRREGWQFAPPPAGEHLRGEWRYQAHHPAHARPDVSRETTVTFERPLAPLPDPPQETQLMEVPEETVLSGTIVEDSWDWGDVHPARMPSTTDQVEQMLAAITGKVPARA